MAPQTATLHEEMFAVYVPERWSSNVHNLTRMRNKDALVALARAVGEALGSELAGLARQTSDEIPNVTNHRRVASQWAYWFRDAEARNALSSFLERTKLSQADLFALAAHEKHAVLGLEMTREGLWTGLYLAPHASVDRRNLAAKLTQSWEREHLRQLLAELPEDVTVRLGERSVSCRAVDDALLEEMVGELRDGKAAWAVGRTTAAEGVAALSGDLEGHVAALLGTLVPLYRFAAWSRDNDLIEAGRKIQQEKAEKRRAASAFDAGQRVRFIAGLMQGKQGTVQNLEAKGRVRVTVGTVSVVVNGSDIVAAAQ